MKEAEQLAGRPGTVPVVSVVLPVYNGAATVADTIESVLQQTLPRFELIVINDGSTDPTLDIVGKLSDSRVTVYSFENKGLAVSRNRGIRRAGAELVAFIDADDLWSADKLERQVEALQANPEAGWAYSWTDMIDEHNRFLNYGSHVHYEGEVFKNLLVGDFMDNGSNPTVRKAVFEHVGFFDETLTAAEDWDMWLRIAYDYPLVCVPAVQIFYRVHGSAMSSSIERQEAECKKVVSRALNRMEPSAEKDKLIRDGRRHLYHYLAARVAQTQKGLAGGRMAIGYLRNFWNCTPSRLRDLPQVSVLSIKIAIVSLLPESLSKVVLRCISTLRGRNRIVSIADLRR